MGPQSGCPLNKERSGTILNNVNNSWTIHGLKSISLKCCKLEVLLEYSVRDNDSGKMISYYGL